MRLLMTPYLHVGLIEGPQDPIASFTLGDIMSISFHPSGRQFLVSHSRSGRDEVTSFHLVSDGEVEVWKERDDITLTSRAGTPYDEVCPGNDISTPKGWGLTVDERYPVCQLGQGDLRSVE